MNFLKPRANHSQQQRLPLRQQQQQSQADGTGGKKVRFPQLGQWKKAVHQLQFNLALKQLRKKKASRSQRSTNSHRSDDDTSISMSMASDIFSTSSAAEAAAAATVAERPRMILRFAPCNEVCETISRHDYTEEEIADCWYSAEEYDRISYKYERLLQRWENEHGQHHHQRHNDDSTCSSSNHDSASSSSKTPTQRKKKYCMRGLEKLLGARWAEVHYNRDLAYSLILEEQANQWKNGVCQPERIANLYHFEVSYDCQEIAAEMGRKDRVAIKSYIAGFSYAAPTSPFCTATIRIPAAPGAPSASAPIRSSIVRARGCDESITNANHAAALKVEDDDRSLGDSTIHSMLKHEFDECGTDQPHKVRVENKQTNPNARPGKSTAQSKQAPSFPGTLSKISNHDLQHTVICNAAA